MHAVAARAPDSGRAPRTGRPHVSFRNLGRRAIRAAASYGSPAASGSRSFPPARDQGIAIYTLVLGGIHSTDCNNAFAVNIRVGGGDNREQRIAGLEAAVESLKSEVEELRRLFSE